MLQRGGGGGGWKIIMHTERHKTFVSSLTLWLRIPIYSFNHRFIYILNKNVADFNAHCFTEYLLSTRKIEQKYTVAEWVEIPQKLVPACLLGLKLSYETCMILLSSLPQPYTINSFTQSIRVLCLKNLHLLVSVVWCATCPTTWHSWQKDKFLLAQVGFELITW